VIPSRSPSDPARTFAAVLALGLALGCATPPKPPELSAFEKLRADPVSASAARKAPDLVSGADRWLARAREEWQSNDLDEAVHSAQMGQIKLKQAIAMAEQDRGRARLAAATSELEKANDENARLQKELGALNAQVALLQRLQAQSAELSAGKKELDTERQRAVVTEKISVAELALKNADALRADQNAKGQYQAALDLFHRAQQEVQQGNYAGAQISAEMAKKKADEAAEVSRPIYQEEARSAEGRAQAEDLAREAATIDGITVRRDARGAVQRLVLPVPADALFVRRETTIGPGKGGVLLDKLASLIKKYSAYSVQVVGYSDSRGRSGELLALSLARAQSVYAALVSRGVDPRRLVVSGQGAAEPISDNRTVAGRARNNRVEIMFVYQ
jgi:outer membrane protein OmpA-like peptidoglycan-associated protein